MHRNQGTPSGDVDRGRKFEEVFAAMVPAANENWDSKRQANPLAAFWSRLVVVQPSLPLCHEKRFRRTSWAKLMMTNDKGYRVETYSASGGVKTLCFVRWIRGFHRISP
jgi:hypothetical protein